jgi:DNA-binding HxlR family transcriptional regulator
VNTFTTRASSINRALDQVGDKWCLLIIQEVFWGINTFSEMLATTGASRGVLADRLRWLQQVDCLTRAPGREGGKRMIYRLTPKSIELYDSALMALEWERRFFPTPELERVELTHHVCGHVFTPRMRCRGCNEAIDIHDVAYKPGPGATQDKRDKKVRRRSSLSVQDVPSRRSVYRNLINIVGDRWTANVLALSFHGFKRFEQFHEELPVATNILADRLKFLVEHGIFEQVLYNQRPPRYEYELTGKGEATYPWFLSILQWGDKWCDPIGAGKPMRLIHKTCGQTLHGQVKCSECDSVLNAQEVRFHLGDPQVA